MTLAAITALIASFTALGLDPVGADSSPPVTTSAVPSCDGMTTSEGLTRDQLATRYGIDQLHAAGFTGAGLTVAAIENSTSADSALVDQFLACQHFPGVTVDTNWIEPRAHAAVGNEATVDVETLAEMLPGVGTIHVLQLPRGGDFADRFSATLDWLLAQMASGAFVPDVLSMSIGTCEARVPQHKVDEIEKKLEKVAGAGVWFMKSAGDAGSSDCTGHKHCGTSHTELAVEYPTTSQWVTAVGGSEFVDSAPIGDAVVWKQKCSAGGGGTSIRVARPAWQDTAGAGAFRTIPDITGLAGKPWYLTLVPDANYTSTAGWEGDGGTSLSTPLYAAGMALVRQQLQARGVAIPTDLNAALYRIAADPALRPLVYTDVTVGDNDLYGVGCCTATTGYDRASGWGELNLAAFAAALTGDLPTPTPPVTPVPPAFTG